MRALSLGWTVKPSGGRTHASPRVLRVSTEMAVWRQFAGLEEHSLQLLLVVAQRGLGVLDRDVATTDERLGVELADRALGWSMRLYMSGWVIDGSSPSLCPRRR
jgi:hypothetical protein